MKRIRTNFALNTLSQLLRLITPFITTPYVARVLGVNNVGVFSFAYSQQSFFCLVAVLGTVSYGSREIARSRDDINQTSRKFWEIELLTIFTSLLTIAGWSLMIVLHPENRILYALLTMYLVAAMLDISWLYTGLELFPYIVARSVFVRLLEVAAIFLFVKGRNDLPLYCAIMGGGTLIGNASLWISAKKNLIRVRFRELRPFRHLKGTLTFFLPAIATTIYTVLDKTLIGAITRESYENGIYEQATKVIEIAKAITFTSLNAVLSPRSAYLFANKEYGKIKENLKLSLDVMMVLGFGFAFGIAAVSNRFVPAFFGAGYEGTVLLLKLLAPIIVIITVSNALGSQYYDPAGLRLKSSMYLITGACCNLVLNLILIPRMKSSGAIIASVIAELVITVLYLRNCAGYLSLRQVLLTSYKKAIAGGIMFVLTSLMYRVIPNTITGLVVLVAFGGLSYLVALFLLRDNAVVYVWTEIRKRFGRKNADSE